MKEPEKEEPGKVKIKCPEIPILKNYDSDPGKEFWSVFPKRLFPNKISTDINVENLENAEREKPILDDRRKTKGNEDC